MIIKHKQQSERGVTWFTELTGVLKADGCTLLSGKETTVWYGGLQYTIEPFEHTFSPDEQHLTEFRLYLAPCGDSEDARLLLGSYESESNLTLDICVQDGLHEWPQPLPREHMFGHNVLLAWGLVKAKGEEVYVSCIEHTEKQV